MSINIAIDGPAGAGKSTIARIIAGKLGFIYVDTGAMYRAMALYTIEEGLEATDSKLIEDKISQAQVSIRFVNGEQRVFLNDRDVTSYLREEKIGVTASKVSAIPKVREVLTALQRKLAANENVVMDGRDIGTTVLPDAQVKVYLDASVHVRALRRYDELVSKGEEADLEKIEKDIVERDYADMHRDISPLTKASDAVVFDSSDMSIEQVVDAVIALI